MQRLAKSLVLIGALVGLSTSALAEKEFETQVGKFDLDPFDVLAPRTPEPPKAEARKPKAHHHRMRRHMKKM